MNGFLRRTGIASIPTVTRVVRNRGKSWNSNRIRQYPSLWSGKAEKQTERKSFMEPARQSSAGYLATDNSCASPLLISLSKSSRYWVSSGEGPLVRSPRGASLTAYCYRHPEESRIGAGTVLSSRYPWDLREILMGTRPLRVPRWQAISSRYPWIPLFMCVFWKQPVLLKFAVVSESILWSICNRIVHIKGHSGN